MQQTTQFLVTKQQKRKNFSHRKKFTEQTFSILLNCKITYLMLYYWSSDKLSHFDIECVAIGDSPAAKTYMWSRKKSS